MKTYNWGHPLLLPDGHRLFRAGTTDRYAIADESGGFPHETEDGVLWLDQEWDLIIASPDNVLCIPVKDEFEQRYSTPTDMSTMLWLSTKFGWSIIDQFTNRIYTIKEA